MSTTEHTPRPQTQSLPKLKLVDPFDGAALEIQTVETPVRLLGWLVHRADNPNRATLEEAKDYGEQIVRACNSHEALVEVAMKIIRAWPHRNEAGYMAVVAEATDDARAAIKDAGIE